MFLSASVSYTHLDVYKRQCMGSMIGYFVIILLAAGSVLAAALFCRHRQKQVMDGLSDMLEAAINGTFRCV